MIWGFSLYASLELKMKKCVTCVKCGENGPVVLEFDHVRGKKKANITDMAHAGYSIKTLQEEIDKCQVLCANCHRRKTSEQQGWFRK